MYSLKILHDWFCQSLFRSVFQLSCWGGKKPFKGSHWWRCHIIHQQIVSGDIYVEVVGTSSKDTSFLRHWGYACSQSHFLMWQKMPCVTENSSHRKPVQNLLLQTAVFVWMHVLDCTKRILCSLVSAILKPMCDLCKSSMTHEAGHHWAFDCTHDELMLYFSYMHSVPKARLKAAVTKAHSAPGLWAQG